MRNPTSATILEVFDAGVRSAGDLEQCSGEKRHDLHDRHAKVPDS
jgi:hypothetical protein